MSLCVVVKQRANIGLIQATLIGGGGGIFEIPPSAKNLERTPLKILGKNFRKTGKNSEIQVNLTGFSLN